jgi:hypothetical protein
MNEIRKNVIRKNVQSRPPFERTLLFDRNEFQKNNRQISKEHYSIKQPIPDDFPNAIMRKQIFQK